MRSSSGQRPHRQTQTPDYLNLITQVMRQANRKTTEEDERESDESDSYRPSHLTRVSRRHRDSNRQPASSSRRKPQPRPRQRMATQVDQSSLPPSPHFLSNINHYLDSLSANSQPHHTPHHTPNALQQLLRRGDEELLRHRRSQQKHRKTQPTPPKSHQIAQIAEQNAALRKAVARQESRIEQMQEEISSHLEQMVQNSVIAGKERRSNAAKSQNQYER